MKTKTQPITGQAENFIRYKGKGEHSVNELEKIIEQREEELHQLKAKPASYFEGIAQGNLTQGEILMRFINSDAVEIYSITPKHRTICILKCHDVNGVQVFTYEELKANAERMVKAMNILSAIEKKICVLDDCIVDASLNLEATIEFNCLKEILKQAE